MVLAVTFLSCLAMQQLSVAPFPAEIGQRVLVRAEGREPERQPIAALRVQVELPDGARQEVGATDAGGEVQFVPQQAGTYVYSAEVGGVRVVAPHRVVPARPRWLPAIVCVPLGLALLWHHLRRRR